tara:strand:- start:673 stop:1497 length:825 start_codon:yes stop_codon:yes gene_type:complete
MDRSIFDYPNTIEDIIGYDPEVTLDGKPQSLLRALTNYKRVDKGAPQQPSTSFLDPSSEANYKFSNDTISPYQYLNRGVLDTHVSGTSPQFNAEQNKSKSSPSNFQTSPTSGLYADATEPVPSGMGMLPKPLADEVARYNLRTPTDLFLKGLTALSPIDILDLLRGTPSYKESDYLHPKRRSTIDRDEFGSPTVVNDLTRLPSQPSLGSSEQLQDLLKHYGLVTDNELPISELISMFVAPTLALRAGTGAMQGISKATSSPNSSISDYINSLLR